MGDKSEWPSAAVAIAVVLLVGAITITAIIRYPVKDALEIWTALAGIVGLLTGAFVTYFFSRKTEAAAKETAKAAQETARTAQETARSAQERAEVTSRALTAVAGSVDQDVWRGLVSQVPDLRTMVVGPR